MNYSKSVFTPNRTKSLHRVEISSLPSLTSSRTLRTDPKIIHTQIGRQQYRISILLQTNPQQITLVQCAMVTPWCPICIHLILWSHVILLQLFSGKVQRLLPWNELKNLSKTVPPRKLNKKKKTSWFVGFPLFIHIDNYNLYLCSCNFVYLFYNSSLKYNMPLELCT